VDFGQPRLFAPAGVDHVIAPTTVVEYCALVERSITSQAWKYFTPPEAVGVVVAGDSPGAAVAALAAKTFAPAMASSSSCCALAAPLTPTAPMIWLVYDHRDPALQRSEIVERDIAVRPFLMMSSKNLSAS